MRLHTKIVCNTKDYITNVLECVLHVSLSECSFSYYAQQYKVGRDVYYVQPYPETSSTVVHGPRS